MAEADEAIQVAFIPFGVLNGTYYPDTMRIKRTYNLSPETVATVKRLAEVGRIAATQYEPFHRAAALTVCPITAVQETVRYPNEVAVPVGEGGQTRAGVILCHQVRTISFLRATGSLAPIGYLTNPVLREQVRAALARHMGLDIPAASDGATGSRAF